MTAMTIEDAARILDLEIPMDDPEEVDPEDEEGTTASAGKSEAREVRDALKAEARERVGGREYIRDLSEPGRKDYLDRGRGTRRSQELLGAVTVDHFAFTIHRTSNPDLPELCRYCGDRLVMPADEYPCEFTGSPPAVATTYRRQVDGLPLVVVEYGPEHRGRFSQPRPILREVIPASRVVPGTLPDPEKFHCRCNGCKLREMGNRKRGGQRVQCGAPQCSKALRRDQKRKERRRKSVALNP